MDAAFCSVAEAAAFLGMPRKTVYDLIANDEFPIRTVRMGRRILVDQAALTRFAKGEVA